MRPSKPERIRTAENVDAVSESMQEKYSGEVGERIARKAYELYEQRGRQAGRELDDWLTAEELIRKEMNDAPE